MMSNVGLGIEYQGARRKGAALGEEQVVLVADDVAVHGEIMRRLHANLETGSFGSTQNTAHRIAVLVKKYRLEEVIEQYLVPLSLNTTIFVESQKLVVSS